MGKGKIDKQVYEQYVDATVALFMEHYAVALTDTIDQLSGCTMLCPEKLDERCIGIIRKECAKQRGRVLWKGAKKVLSSVAILLIVLLSLSSILFMTVEAFRVPVINFFIEQGDGFWVITGRNSDDPVEPSNSERFIESDPLAGLLPEEYKVERTSGNMEKGLRIVYINHEGQRVRFATTRTSHITIDSEDTEVSKDCWLMEYPGVFVLKDNLCQLAWVDETECISYLLSADSLSESEIFSVAEQIMKKFLK